MVKFHVFGARRRSLLVYRGDDGIQAVFSIILRGDGLALSHAIDMNHACRFKEDGPSLLPVQLKSMKYIMRDYYSNKIPII